MSDLPTEQDKLKLEEIKTPIEEVKEETPVDDVEKASIQKLPEGLQLNLGNSEMIKIKLLESIQNINIRQLKVLEAMAVKQGINLNMIK